MSFSNKSIINQFKGVFLLINFIVIFLFITGCTSRAVITGENKVHIGEEITLVTSRNGNFIWESSDDNIATVKDGKVIGISIGTATISILKDNKTIATYNLNVIPQKSINLTGKTYLLVGEETTLNITSNFEYSNALWISSDENVVTVSNGVLCGLSKGNATISVEIDNVKEYVDIKVIENYEPEIVKIDPLLPEYMVGNPYKLTAKAFPEYTLQDFKWEVAGNKATINSDTGEITILDDGEIWVICRSKYSDYVFNTASLKAKYSGDVKITNIMFVGNSLTYVNDIPSMIANMGKVNGKVIKTTSFTPGGNTLENILDTHEYSINTTLKNKYHDYMIIQEASAANFTNYPSFLASAKEYKEIADTYNTTLLLYQTWAYKDNCDYLNIRRLSRETMQGYIIDAYDNVSNEINANINPVGEIFYNFSLAYPDLELYMDYNHASLIGSYLSSCVHYICLFNESVIGNEYVVKIDDEVKLLIQTYVTNYLLG
jgi:hypothetical protein